MSNVYFGLCFFCCFSNLKSEFFCSVMSEFLFSLYEYFGIKYQGVIAIKITLFVQYSRFYAISKSV